LHYNIFIMSDDGLGRSRRRPPFPIRFWLFWQAPAAGVVVARPGALSGKSSVAANR
jgi:hypothetical protein